MEDFACKPPTINSPIRVFQEYTPPEVLPNYPVSQVQTPQERSILLQNDMIYPQIQHNNQIKEEIIPEDPFLETKNSILHLNTAVGLNDPSLIMDVLNMNITSKIEQMDVEAAIIFLQKSILLVESKFDHHVKAGLEFISRKLHQFQDEIIARKTTKVMNDFDFAGALREYKGVLTTHSEA